LTLPSVVSAATLNSYRLAGFKRVALNDIAAAVTPMNTVVHPPPPLPPGECVWGCTTGRQSAASAGTSRISTRYPATTDPLRVSGDAHRTCVYRHKHRRWTLPAR
jgi:hypothetical protein